MQSCSGPQGLSFLEFPPQYSVLETLVTDREAKPLPSSPITEITHPLQRHNFTKQTGCRQLQLCTLASVPVGMFSVSDANAMPHLEVDLNSKTPVPKAQAVHCLDSCEKTLIL